MNCKQWGALVKALPHELITVWGAEGATVTSRTMKSFIKDALVYRINYLKHDYEENARSLERSLLELKSLQGEKKTKRDRLRLMVLSQLERNPFRKGGLALGFLPFLRAIISRLPLVVLYN